MKMIYNRHHILKLAALGAVLLTFHISGTSGALAPPTDADCTSPNPFPDPDNCTCYYQCFDVNPGWTLVHMCCPIGGYWDDTIKSCVGGNCPGVITTTQPTTDPPAFTCLSAGLFSDPIVPRKYYHCILIGTQFYHHVYYLS